MSRIVRCALVANVSLILCASTVGAASGNMMEKLSVGDLVSTVVYSLLGIVLSLLSYRIFNFSVPFDLTKELEDDQNVALGLVCGAMMLGVAIIIAAAISS